MHISSSVGRQVGADGQLLEHRAGPRAHVVGRESKQSKATPRCGAQLPGGDMIREGNSAKLCQCVHTACLLDFS